MYCLSTSELYIKRIQNLTRSVKLGSKKPNEIAIEISNNFEKLRPISESWHEDLMTEYKNVIAEFKRKEDNN